MSSNCNCLEDRRLKECCLAAEQVGWDQLYAANFLDLVSYARSLLVTGPIPWLTADDVAENVFSSLWENECYLVHYYDPERAPWQAFLRLLARRQIITCHRREHECPLGDRDLVDPGADQGLAEAQFHEFAATLPPTLKRYFAEEFLGAEGPVASPRSPAADYKRRQRLLRRAMDHFQSQ